MTERTPPKPVTFRQRLVIMVKEPVAGRVKTRLAREIGTAAALRFYRANLAALAARLGRDPRWQTIFTVAPPAALSSRALPPGPARAAQPGGDIGRRMQRGLAAPLPGRVTPGPVVLIGSDIAAVTPAHVAEAFRLLARNDLVFGPAADGGFWLVGLRRAPRLIDAFAGPVRWSSAETLADCLANTARHRVALAATLSDTDNARDVSALGRAAGRRVLPRPTALSPSPCTD